MNFEAVIANILKHYRDNCDHNDRLRWHEAIDDMLDDLSYEDFFGTERQLDPRGDQRK